MKQLQPPPAPALPPPTQAPHSFSSPSSLSDTLLRHGIPTETWGVAPGSKTLQNLWIEISNGDSHLFLTPASHVSGAMNMTITRVVRVAIVNIKNARGAALIESHQLLSDGTVRHRNRPLSEKMKPGESIEDAAARGAREELGEGARLSRVSTHEVKIDDLKSSVSYPGLPARYEIHSVDAFLDGGGDGGDGHRLIPQDGEFSTEENGEGSADEEKDGQAVFVRKHFWKWVDDHPHANPPIPNSTHSS